MTYSEKAPNISKHVTKTALETVIKEEMPKGGSGQVNITKSKVEAVLPYLKWHDAEFFPPGKEQYDMGYGQIASEVGLTKEQVSKLHQEYLKVKADVMKPEEEVI